MPTDKQIQYWESLKGRKLTTEHKEKMRAALVGRSVSEETKSKIRSSLIGRKHDKHRIEKSRLSRIGRKWSEAERKSHDGCHSGEKHHNWKGGKTTDRKTGYIRLYTRKHEHRVVAEKYLCRPLTKKEVVHHINLNPSDNRPENLYVFENQNQHRHFHTKVRKNKDFAATLKSNIL